MWYNINIKIMGGDDMKLLTRVLMVLLCASMGIGVVPYLNGVNRGQEKEVDVIYSYYTTQSELCSTENANEFEENVSEEDGVNIIFKFGGQISTKPIRLVFGIYGLSCTL